mmetsp:Transcript_58776/g.110118  ORF Transcript_58776/g.110118 Transcript_58776/m.110118 type:complete len:165 (-) Transcript_58776:51-545(-)
MALKVEQDVPEIKITKPAQDCDFPDSKEYARQLSCESASTALPGDLCSRSTLELAHEAQDSGDSASTSTSFWAWERRPRPRQEKTPDIIQREIVTSVDNWFENGLFFPNARHQSTGTRSQTRKSPRSVEGASKNSKQQREMLTAVDDWLDLGALFECMAARSKQ